MHNGHQNLNWICPYRRKEIYKHNNSGGNEGIASRPSALNVSHLSLRAWRNLSLRSPRAVISLWPGPGRPPLTTYTLTSTNEPWSVIMTLHCICYICFLHEVQWTKPSQEAMLHSQYSLPNLDRLQLRVYKKLAHMCKHLANYCNCCIAAIHHWTREIKGIESLVGRCFACYDASHQQTENSHKLVDHPQVGWCAYMSARMIVPSGAKTLHDKVHSPSLAIQVSINGA